MELEQYEHGSGSIKGVALAVGVGHPAIIREDDEVGLVTFRTELPQRYPKLDRVSDTVLLDLEPKFKRLRLIDVTRTLVTIRNAYALFVYTTS